MCSDGWCCDPNVFSPGRVEEMDSVETEACKFEHRRATSGGCLNISVMRTVRGARTTSQAAVLDCLMCANEGMRKTDQGGFSITRQSCPMTLE